MEADIIAQNLKRINPQDHDYNAGGDGGHGGGHGGGRGAGGGGHHDDGEDPSFNGDDFTHFEREFRGGIQPTDYYEDFYPRKFPAFVHSNSKFLLVFTFMAHFDSRLFLPAAELSGLRMLHYPHVGGEGMGAY